MAEKVLRDTRRSQNLRTTANTRLLNEGLRGIEFPAWLRLSAERAYEALLPWGKTIEDALHFYLAHLEKDENECAPSKSNRRIDQSSQGRWPVRRVLLRPQASCWPIQRRFLRQDNSRHFHCRHRFMASWARRRSWNSQYISARPSDAVLFLHHPRLLSGKSCYWLTASESYRFTNRGSDAGSAFNLAEKRKPARGALHRDRSVRRFTGGRDRASRRFPKPLPRAIFVARSLAGAMHFHASPSVTTTASVFSNREFTGRGSLRPVRN